MAARTYNKHSTSLSIDKSGICTKCVTGANNRRERVSDIADRANDTAQLHLDATLRNKRLEQAANSAKASADECVECGYLIPSERQLAIPGVDLCVSCAEKQERRDNLRAG
jgi:phage/conjugal plasmid C-4 type zinc finger TraR family protein